MERIKSTLPRGVSNYSSGAEVQSHLYVALDQGYVTQNDFESIYAQADVVARMDSGFIKYLPR